VLVVAAVATAADGRRRNQFLFPIYSFIDRPTGRPTDRLHDDNDRLSVQLSSHTYFIFSSPSPWPPLVTFRYRTLRLSSQVIRENVHTCVRAHTADLALFRVVVFFFVKRKENSQCYNADGVYGNFITFLSFSLFQIIKKG